MTKRSVITEALKLPEADRLEVVEALYDSLDGPTDPDIDAAWAAEIQRRIASIDAGEGKMIPWEKVRRQMIKGGNADASAD
jgi:putative addiction module component (TIGR02574 family)